MGHESNDPDDSKTTSSAVAGDRAGGPENRRRRAVRSPDEKLHLVAPFDEDTPERLIREVRPHVLVKGGDWAHEHIVGGGFVASYGGRVARIRLREGLGTTLLIERIVARG